MTTPAAVELQLHKLHNTVDKYEPGFVCLFAFVD